MTGVGASALKTLAVHILRREVQPRLCLQRGEVVWTTNLPRHLRNRLRLPLGRLTERRLRLDLH